MKCTVFAAKEKNKNEQQLTTLSSRNRNQEEQIAYISNKQQNMDLEIEYNRRERSTVSLRQKTLLMPSPFPKMEKSRILETGHFGI